MRKFKIGDEVIAQDSLDQTPLQGVIIEWDGFIYTIETREEDKYVSHDCYYEEEIRHLTKLELALK